MKRFIITVLLFINITTYSSVTRSGIDPTLDWYTIESEHLIIHFADGYKQLAEKAIIIAEKAHARHTKDLNWQPVEKTHIVISDEIDVPNGYAMPIYFNRTVLFVAPPTNINTLEDFDDWFTTLITHEYLHIIHLDKSEGSPEFLRNVFGRFMFLFPNLFQPSWVHEGLATFSETDIERGIGRGQSTLYKTMMREEVINGLQPIDHVNLPVSTWPAGTTRYLYGTYFMKYIAEMQSEQALHDWVQGYSNNLIPFFINTNARQTLGGNLDLLWEDYSSWLKRKFVPQIAQIKQAGLKEGVQVTSNAFRTDSIDVLGDDAYYVRNNGYSQPTLMHIGKNNQYTELVELNTSAGINVHKDKGVLVTQGEFCGRYHIYGDIYNYVLDTGKLLRLTECGRYLYAVWNPDGNKIYAVHHDAGKMEIHQLNDEGVLENRVWKGSNEEVISKIDISPDGNHLVAALWRKEQGWNIETLDLKSKQWTAITSGTEIESTPQYTPGGNILFGHEADNAYNLYLYNSANKQVSKITNSLGGAFEGSQGKKDGPIYYTGYTAEGHTIFRLDDTTAIETANVSSGTKLTPYNYQLGNHPQREYSAWPSMRPRWWFPVIGYSDQRAPIGISTAGFDALAIHNYSASLAWDFMLDEIEASLSYGYADRLFISYARLNEISLDSNDNLAYSTARDVAGLAVAFPFRKVLQQHDLLAGIFYDREYVNEIGTTTPVLNDLEDNLLGVAWLYDSSNLYPLSISKNDGMDLRLVVEDSDTLNSDFSGQVYTLDWQQFIRTGDESVLALHFVQGYGTDNPRKFELGGEDIGFDALSFIFNGQSQAVFNQRKYPLRGYKEGQQQLRGRRAQLLTGEWRFPIQRNERGIMAPPIGLMQWFGSVFAETGAAYQDSPDTYYSSAGAEVSADVNLFYHLTLRLRLGYAHGFDDQIGDDRVYLTAGGLF